MSGPLRSIALVIALTHGLRVLGQVVGPRWCGLVLGLPSTTVIALWMCLQEQGAGAASEMADASLFGMAGAVVLALGFALLSRRGWRLSWLLAAVVALYAVAILALQGLAPIGLSERLILPLLVLLAASEVAGRIRASPGMRSRGPIAPRMMLVLRTLVPVACLLLVTLVRTRAGATWAGLMSTFPALSLTLLIVTHLEAGPISASRMASVLPSANLSTYAFLAIFRLGCLRLGPTGALAWGYLAALAVLPLVVRLAQRNDRALIRAAPRVLASPAWRRHPAGRLLTLRTRPGRAPVFAPGLELLV